MANMKISKAGYDALTPAGKRVVDEIVKAAEGKGNKNPRLPDDDFAKLSDSDRSTFLQLKKLAREKLSGKKKVEKSSGTLTSALSEWHKEKPMVAMRMETVFLQWLNLFSDEDQKVIVANIEKGRTNEEIQSLVRDIVLSYRPKSDDPHAEQDQLLVIYKLL